MAISGKNLREVGTEFTTHLTRLLARTINPKPLILVPTEPNRIYISFRDKGRISTASLRTMYGEMDLSIFQLCDAVEDENTGKVHLRTVEYAYTLRPITLPEPLFRWEYVRFPEPNAEGEAPEWCRHHLQGAIKLELEDGRGSKHQLPLNDWHLPTGWVAIEEVIRFCIVDLGVPAQTGWEAELRGSYERFKTEFSIIGDR